MKSKFFIAIAFIGILLVVTACGTPSVDSASEHVEDEHVEDEHAEDEHVEDGHAEDGHAEDEHMEEEMEMDHSHVEAPDEFADLTNPFAGDADAVAAGQELFVTNCVTCHGPEGAGDGAAAVGLDPKPANLGDNEMMSMLSDGYLFWRVSKGGLTEPFNSAMPAWETGLTNEQLWQIISYVRTFTEQ